MFNCFGGSESALQFISPIVLSCSTCDKVQHSLNARYNAFECNRTGTTETEHCLFVFGTEKVYRASKFDSHFRLNRSLQVMRFMVTYTNPKTHSALRISMNLVIF